MMAQSIDNGRGGGFKAARDKAFRTAQRHTLLVRVLRLALPVTAVALLASYGVFVRQSYRIETTKGEITFGTMSITTESLKAHDPRYTGFNDDGSRYVVVAKTAEQDFRQAGPIKLETIDGQLTDTGDAVTRLKAVRGDYFDKTGVLELFDRIDVDGDNGLKAKLSRATVVTKEQRITSDEPVTVDMPGTNVRGNRLVIEQKKRHVLFFDGVETRLTQDQAKGPRPQRTDAAAGLVAGDGPIDVTSRQLAIDDLAKTALFSGDVIARQGPATLTTPELEVFYEDGAAAPPAAGATASTTSNRVKLIRARRDVVMVNGPQKATGSKADFDQRQDTMRLYGPVVITQEPGRKATGSKADFDQRQDTMRLYGPVVITQEPDRNATSDEALVDNKADTILLTGTVVVTQARNVLRGRRMLVNRKSGIMQMTSPADAAGAAGRVYARLYANDAEPAGQAGAAKKRPPAKKADDSSGLLNVRRDPSEPIDIDAASLDVDDNAKLAIFRGNVVAVQGDYTIRTPELVALYTGDSAFSVGGTAPAAAPDRKSGTELRKVEARQRVAILTKDGRTATADKAEFDPKDNIAVLTGNVTLTQERAVTKGNRATMDMTTGTFRIVEELAGTPSSSGKGRASLLLYPDQIRSTVKANSAEKDKADAEKKAAPAAPPTPAGPVPKRPSTSGWSNEPSSPFDNR